MDWTNESSMHTLQLAIDTPPIVSSDHSVSSWPYAVPV